MDIKKHFKKERRLITWGIVVGLVLGLGVWLVILNDLGARLATVGAFIAAILTPVIAFVVNTYLPTANKAADPANAPDSVARNSRIIVISSLVALIVTVAIVWATPRVMDAMQQHFFHAYDTETVDTNKLALTGNTNMKDGDTAHVTLPKTNHTQLAITFSAKNTESTTLCANSATVRLTVAGKSSTVAADTESIITLTKTGVEHQLDATLVFLPETDPSCELTLNVASASYSK